MSTGNPNFDRLEGEKREADFGGFYPEVRVKIDASGGVMFMADVIEKHAASFMSESSAQALFDAGVLKKGNPADSKSKYELASEGHDGYVHLDKDELNQAIKDGKLKIEITPEGDIEVI